MQDLYSLGFPKGLWSGTLRRAMHSLLWGWGRLNLTMRCRNPSHKLQTHLRKGPLGCAGVVSHLLLPYLLDASSCSPLPHCVPQPSGNRCDSKLPFPCLGLSPQCPIPFCPVPVPSSGPTAEDPLCFNTMPHLWL